MTIAAVTKSSRATNHIGRTDGRPFPLPSVADISLPHLPHIRTCDIPRKTTMKCDLDHRDLISPGKMHEQVARLRYEGR